MKKIKLNNALKASFSCFGKGRLVGLLVLLITQLSIAQNNNMKQEYDLNDPRNPDCPCHKYQKLADVEFKNLQNSKETINLPEIIQTVEANKSDVQRVVGTNVKNTYANGERGLSVKQKRKTLFTRMKKDLFFITTKPKKTKKIKPCYSVCYKW